MKGKVDHIYFKDGTPLKKWQRVLLAHAYHFHLTMGQAREAIEINPYLAKHAGDYDRVFEEMPNYFAADAFKCEAALTSYEHWIKQ